MNPHTCVACFFLIISHLLDSQQIKTQQWMSLYGFNDATGAEANFIGIWIRR